MSKSRKLTEEEIAFIEETLDSQEDLELLDENDQQRIRIVQKPKVKKKKIPAYKNPMHWVVAFISAPILLSGAFMFFLFRLETILGAGSLEWLTDSGSGELVKNTAEEMGLTWLPQVLEIYENRWLIIGILFTVFFILAIIVIIYDNIVQTKLNNKKKLTKKVDDGDE